MQYALVLMKDKFWPSIFATVASDRRRRLRTATTGDVVGVGVGVGDGDINNLAGWIKLETDEFN